MNTWITKIKNYMSKFIELGVLLLAISGIAALIIVFAVIFAYRKILK